MSDDDRSDDESARTRRDVLKYSAAIGAVGALPSNAVADEPESSAKDPRAGEDGDRNERGTMSVSSAGNGGTDALVIRDCRPWYQKANDEVLNDQDAGFTVESSGVLDDADFSLSDYGVVVVPSTQSDDYYRNLADAADAFEEFVREGGVLVGHVTDRGYPCTASWDESFLPNDVGHVSEYGSSLTLVDPDHPIYEGIADSELDGWNYSAHGWLTNVPADANVLVENANNGNPTHVEYDVGDGTVVATTQTLEWPFRSSRGTEDVLRNELQYALSAGMRASLSIENARLVQTVENTRVEDPSATGSYVLHEEPDPDLVTSRNTSAAFDLDGSDVSDLTEEVRFVVERDLKEFTSGAETVRTDDFELSPSEVQEFVDAVDGIDALHEFSDSIYAAKHNPVFELDYSTFTTQSVTVRIESPEIQTTSVTLERGEDFEASASRTLHVGFAQVRDPGGGLDYGKDNDGYPRDYEDEVEAAVEYMEKVYPVDEVVAYRHDDPIIGSYYVESRGVGRRRAVQGDQWVDAEESRTVLNEQLPIEQSETVLENGSISEIVGYDETVLIVPEGYFTFHSDGKCGVHVGAGNSQPQVSSLVLDVCAETTTPHEMVHHFTQGLYEGPGADDPMAQRSEYDQNTEQVSLPHARHQNSDIDDDNVEDPPGVLMTKFDLTEGDFTAEKRADSVMSYGNRVEWADSRMFQRLIEDGFTATPPEADDDGNGSSSAQGSKLEPVISGIATAEDDGSVTVDTINRRQGRPMASDEDGDVTLTVRTADGTQIDEFVTNGTWNEQPSHGGATPVNFVPFVLPYPEEAAEIVVEKDGTTSSVDPLSQLLDGVADRIADASFEKNPRERRRALANKFDALSEQIRNGAYRGASNKLENDVRKRVKQWLVADAEVPANFHTRSELLDLIDAALARVETLAESTGTGNGKGGKKGNGNNGKKGNGNNGKKGNGNGKGK